MSITLIHKQFALQFGKVSPHFDDLLLYTTTEKMQLNPGEVGNKCCSTVHYSRFVLTHIQTFAC